MPIYRKGKTKTGESRWQVVIFHKGTRHEFIVRGLKADAEAFEARKRVAFEQEEPAEVRVAPRFSDFCVEWFGRYTKEKELGRRTASNRTYQLATLTEHVGEHRLTDFNEDVVQRFKDARLEAGISRSTINDDLKVLKAMLNYAREKRIPVAVPKITPMKETRRSARERVKAWTKEELERLFTTCQRVSPEILPMVIFLANTGCRKAEALHLRSESVDLKRGVIWIEPSEDWKPKDNEPRQVPLSSALRKWIEPLLTTEYVFRNENDEPWAYWPQRAFDRARKSAVPDNIREKHDAEHEGMLIECKSCSKHALQGGPHKLRHTYASQFLTASTGDMFTLSKILGHSHSSTTALYSHLLPGTLDRAAAMVSFGLPATPPQAA